MNVGKNQTVTVNGSANLHLRGGDTVTVNTAVHDTFTVTSDGNNQVTINEPVVGDYTAHIVSRSGTLKLYPNMLAGAHVDVSGAGSLQMSTTIGGRYGASNATIGIKDVGSAYTVIDNGTLNFASLTFLQQAGSVTLNDLGSPVANIGGPPPVLTVKALAPIAHIAYSQSGGLSLDFANGKQATVTGLHIADAQYYSLVQTGNGDATIEATATRAFTSQGPVYHYTAPATPTGGHVFQL
jgi:hypothetical protein